MQYFIHILYSVHMYKKHHAPQ